MCSKISTEPNSARLLFSPPSDYGAIDINLKKKKNPGSCFRVAAFFQPFLKSTPSTDVFTRSRVWILGVSNGRCSIRARVAFDRRVIIAKKKIKKRKKKRSIGNEKKKHRRRGGARLVYTTNIRRTYINNYRRRWLNDPDVSPTPAPLHAPAPPRRNPIVFEADSPRMGFPLCLRPSNVQRTPAGPCSDFSRISRFISSIFPVRAGHYC